VSVIDNGRNQAPDCIDPEKTYQTTVCKAEGNTGVRAEIRLLDRYLAFIGLIIAGALSLITIVSREFASALTARLTQEIQDRLFDADGKKEGSGSFGKLVECLAKWSGITKAIQRQTDRFKSQIENFEMRVREESALRARKEAESEKSKEYIEKVIRHDIRSPLSSLLIIKDGIRADAQTSKTLASSIRKIQLLIDDLEQVDRAEEEARLVIVEVAAEETVNVLRPKFFRSKEVVLSIDYGERLSPVTVAPEGFRRVLDNLLENAFDAVQTGGEISLSVKSNSSHCEIQILDNGCGIPPELLPKLFLKGGTFGKVNAIGLGLHRFPRL
jgi:signal transduction histidine kinase